MADNVTANSGSGGAVFATDDDGTAHHPYVKLEFGANDTQTKVSTSDPLPVVQTGALTVGLDATALAALETVNVIAALDATSLAALETISVTAALDATSLAALETVTVGAITAGSNLIGDVGISGARTSGGTTIFRSIDLDEGTLEVVKASAGQIFWIHAINIATTVRYIKIYNATSGTAGTGTPVLTLAIPSQGTALGAGFTLSVPNGIAFGTGISIGATTGVADNDTGAPGANEVIVNLGYA